MELKSLKLTDKDVSWELTVESSDLGTTTHKRVKLPQNLYNTYTDLREVVAALLEEDANNFGYLSFTLKETDEGLKGNFSFKKQHGLFYVDCTMKDVPLWPDKAQLASVAEQLEDAESMAVRGKYEKILEALKRRERITVLLGHFNDLLNDPETWVELCKIDHGMQLELDFSTTAKATALEQF